jgi:hypothetical protein
MSNYSHLGRILMSRQIGRLIEIGRLPIDFAIPYLCQHEATMKTHDLKLYRHCYVTSDFTLKIITNSGSTLLTLDGLDSRDTNSD